jgi:DNA-binding response OmpR family regulator
MSKVLLVEDDQQLANALREWFTSNGYVFEHTANGADGLQMLTNFAYDTIILDWMLPGLTGLEVCKQYRKAGGKSHVIFLTGQGETEEIEAGLDAGADDYMVKPFKIRELAARLRSLQRRPSTLISNELTIDNLTLDPVKQVFVVDGQTYQLTAKECGLLEYLMRNPNHPYHSDALVSAVWPSDSSGSAEALRTWIRNLRKKLESAGKGGFIKTIPGVGYVIESST